MAFIPPPYEELSPDGRQYFKILGVSRHLLRMYEHLLTASELALLNPNPRIRATSIQLDSLLLAVKREVEVDARATAVFADERIRERIEATRVRPPTLGKNRNSRLSGGIRSRPVPSVLGPGGGAVGIADIQELIHATLSPSTNSQTPYYWRAQEFGSDHLVGHTLYGVFQPGEARPSGEVRSHPNFEVRGRGQGTRYKMVVRNPIEQRGFLREGAYDAYLYRRRKHEATESAAISQMRRIAGGIAPGGTRGGGRR